MRSLSVWFNALLICLMAVLPVVAGEPTVKVEDPAKCVVCGMDRRMFAYSRALVSFTNGTVTGTCSISCAHEVVQKGAGRSVRLIQVADYDSKRLLNAKEATWVIGGGKQGVMTSVAKWAFTGRMGAERFVKKFGGRVASFDEVWKASGE